MTEERKLELHDFNFSVRLSNGLYGAGVHSLEDLLQLSYGQLASKFRSIGKKTADELRSKLAYHGLTLFGENIITSVDGVAFVKDIPKKLQELREEISLIGHKIASLQHCIDKVICLEVVKK